MLYECKNAWRLAPGSSITSRMKERPKFDEDNVEFFSKLPDTRVDLAVEYLIRR